MADEITEKTCETCKRVYKTQEDFLNNTSQWRLCNAENLWFNCDCGSTLMLPKGKFPWYNPTSDLSDEAQSVFNKIARINELPHIPSAIMNIQQMLQDPEVETLRLAAAVKQDPFLAAEILRVAENLRNLRSRHEKPMQSLEHAISYIGRKSMGNLVLAASIKGFKLPTKDFADQDFWHHSFLAGAIAEIIVQKFECNLDKDKVYLAASLANIGKVIAAICFPEKTDAVQRYINDVNTMTTWKEAEQEIGLVSHTVLGEIGSAIWGLPKFVIDTAKNHHIPVEKRRGLGKNNLSIIAGFANILAHWTMLEPHRIDEQHLSKYRQIFDLNEKQLDELVTTQIMPAQKMVK